MRPHFPLEGIGAGTGGAEGAVVPPTKLLGKQIVHPAPQFFFCNLQLKVTLQTVTQRFSKIPKLLGLCPRPHCTLRIPFSKNTYCIKLHFEFNCLDCFSPIFCFSHGKVVQVLLPQPKNRSHAYVRRATESRWNTSMVSRMSSMTDLMRVTISEIRSTAS